MTSTELRIPPQIAVVASLLIDGAGRVSVAGSSLPLSSAEDRVRLRALRHWSSCILVGSTTHRAGGYERLHVPVLTYSRSIRSIDDWGQELEQVKTLHGHRVLVEAGPNILGQLLGEGLVDRLYLTRTSRESNDPTSPRFEIALLDSSRGMDVIESIAGIEDVFETYQRRGMEPVS